MKIHLEKTINIEFRPRIRTILSMDVPGFQWDAPNPVAGRTIWYGELSDGTFLLQTGDVYGKKVPEVSSCGSFEEVQVEIRDILLGEFNCVVVKGWDTVFIDDEAQEKEPGFDVVPSVLEGWYAVTFDGTAIAHFLSLEKAQEYAAQREAGAEK